MKVRKITIPELHHFKNFELDLTYPAGHEKAGRPLEKVCFIGQSGTGKTTLLKLISILSYETYRYNELDTLETIQKIDFEFEFSDYKVKKHIGTKKENPEVLTSYWNEYYKNGEQNNFEIASSDWMKYWENIKTALIYFPADLKYDFDITESRLNLEFLKVIDFSKHNAADIWKLILSNIQKYQEEEIKIRQEISRVAENSKDIKKIQKAVTKLENWRKRKFNPIEDVARECLDPVLKNFGLKIKTEVEFNTKDDIGFIKVEDYYGKEIAHGLLSTGSKQLILSALPLYLLKPKDSIILYDEPERSLFPDLQKIIIDYYISLTEDSQFFFATHSPIIASNFEPWEIVELKFDKNWNIYRELYYKGENHVDNYLINPQYLNFDLILTKIFDLKDTNTDTRVEAIVEATMLKNQLNELKKQNKLNTKLGKEVFNKYKDLATKLAWNFEN